MRRETGKTAILLIFFVAISLANAAVQRSRADGDRLQRKIDEIAANGSAARTKPKSTSVSESELNSYLAFNLRNDIPRGLAEPEIVMTGKGSVAGRVLVDIDEFNRSRGPQSILDPLSYLSGQLPVTARGVLRTNEGRGRFYLSSAELQGVPLPRSIVQELVRYFSRTADNARGIDMDEPFDLPARIRQIEVDRGEALIVQ
jgi:hypothetical protein